MTHHLTVSVQVLIYSELPEQPISFAEVGLIKGKSPRLNLYHTFLENGFDSNSSLIQAEQLINKRKVLLMIETTTTDPCISLPSLLLPLAHNPLKIHC